MLFNSPLFLFGFLPLVVLIFRMARKVSWQLALATLTLASLVFYCAWNPLGSWPLFVSIIVNYVLGLWLARYRETKGAGAILAFGVIANLCALGYFKYAVFAVTAFQQVTGLFGSIDAVVLPLGISFFTFTQIAYLVDVRRGIASEPSFQNYVLFVTFFPHLIAGPIIHHKEMMPQFERPAARPQGDLVMGLTLFAIGLFKKVMIADLAAHYVGPAFSGGENQVPLIMAWENALCYSVEIYFDFSGYSDMALGLARMFGIVLPLNFNSPYKARNVVDFWRCWHITLSRFLRDYLYFPLGGNRHGPIREYFNVLTVMVLGGFWHGANWTFLAWGGFHGMALLTNHLWRAWQPIPKTNGGLQAFSWGLTLCAVVVGWVIFRAPDLANALSILKGMIGLHGIGGLDVKSAGHGSLIGLGTGVGLMALAMLAPNSQQIMRPAYSEHGVIVPSGPEWLVWRPTALWAVAMGLVLIVGVLNLWSTSEFIYYQF